MKYTHFLLSFCLATSAIPLFGANESIIFDSPTSGKIVVNNRVLAKVNGKPITVIDVMKKMDIVFYREFPEYASSTEARFHFLDANWRAMLDDLIEKQLVLADAEESKMEVSNGDVRQEMETMFGPDIIGNLDKVGISLDEASKIIQGDILLKRMIGMRVHAKAIRIITPASVRDFYDSFSSDKKNERNPEWHYQVISFRDQDPLKSEKSARLAHQLLTDNEANLQNIKEILIAKEALDDSTTLNISEINKHHDQQMSESNKPVILTLVKGTFSEPVSQKSRADRSTVFRIFYLSDKVEGGTIPFTQLENRIREKLIDDAINTESAAYIKRLKEHYHFKDSEVSASIPEDFKPFKLT